MTNANIREAHRIITNAGSVMTREQIDLLRSVLPPLPKQKTLEELRREVYDVWAGTNGNEWPDDVHGDLETWLSELHEQLKGLKDTPAAVPALPAGMRIAVHPDFGRVVVSPGVGIDRCHEIFYLDPGMSSGTDISRAELDALTFIDAEPAKSAHPEFLETEADYAAAPEGTIVALHGRLAWVKEGANDWTCRGGSNGDYSMSLSGRRRVWRWGDK